MENNYDWGQLAAWVMLLLAGFWNIGFSDISNVIIGALCLFVVIGNVAVYLFKTNKHEN